MAIRDFKKDKFEDLKLRLLGQSGDEDAQLESIKEWRKSNFLNPNMVLDLAKGELLSDAVKTELLQECQTNGVDPQSFCDWEFVKAFLMNVQSPDAKFNILFHQVENADIIRFNVKCLEEATLMTPGNDIKSALIYKWNQAKEGVFCTEHFTKEDFANLVSHFNNSGERSGDDILFAHLHLLRNLLQSEQDKTKRLQKLVDVIGDEVAKDGSDDQVIGKWLMNIGLLDKTPADFHHAQARRESLQVTTENPGAKIIDLGFKSLSHLFEDSKFGDYSTKLPDIMRILSQKSAFEKIEIGKAKSVSGGKTGADVDFAGLQESNSRLTTQHDIAENSLRWLRKSAENNFDLNFLHRTFINVPSPSIGILTKVDAAKAWLAKEGNEFSVDYIREEILRLEPSYGVEATAAALTKLGRNVPPEFLDEVSAKYTSPHAQGIVSPVLNRIRQEHNHLYQGDFESFKSFLQQPQINPEQVNSHAEKWIENTPHVTANQVQELALLSGSEMLLQVNLLKKYLVRKQVEKGSQGGVATFEENFAELSQSFGGGLEILKKPLLKDLVTNNREIFGAIDLEGERLKPEIKVTAPQPPETGKTGVEYRRGVKKAEGLPPAIPQSNIADLPDIQNRLEHPLPAPTGTELFERRKAAPQKFVEFDSQLMDGKYSFDAAEDVMRRMKTLKGDYSREDFVDVLSKMPNPSMLKLFQTHITSSNVNWENLSVLMMRHNVSHGVRADAATHWLKKEGNNFDLRTFHDVFMFHPENVVGKQTKMKGAMQWLQKENNNFPVEYLRHEILPLGGAQAAPIIVKSMNKAGSEINQQFVDEAIARCDGSANKETISKEWQKLSQKPSSTTVERETNSLLNSRAEGLPQINKRGGGAKASR